MILRFKSFHPLVNQEILDDFMGRFNLGGTQIHTNSRYHSEELQRYLKCEIPIANPFEFKLYEWWFENRHTFKNLFRLFVIYASFCASNAPSERNFSTAGIILEACRSCLLPETVENLILARNKYLNYQ